MISICKELFGGTTLCVSYLHKHNYINHFSKPQNKSNRMGPKQLLVLNSLITAMNFETICKSFEIYTDSIWISSKKFLYSWLLFIKTSWTFNGSVLFWNYLGNWLHSLTYKNSLKVIHFYISPTNLSDLFKHFDYYSFWIKLFRTLMNWCSWLLWINP